MTLADGSQGGRAGTATAVAAVEQGFGDEAVEAFPGIATAADTDTLALDLVVGTVVQVAPAQGVGREAIVAGVVTASQHRPVELGVLTHPDIKALFTSKHPGLLHHALVVTVDLLATGVDIGGAGHGTKGKAAPCRDAVLFALVVVGILLTGQVVADIGLDIRRGDKGLLIVLFIHLGVGFHVRGGDARSRFFNTLHRLCLALHRLRGSVATQFDQTGLHHGLQAFY